MYAFDRQTDRQTEFSSLDRVCIPCSAVKWMMFWLSTLSTMSFKWICWETMYRFVFWSTLQYMTLASDDSVLAYLLILCVPWNRWRCCSWRQTTSACSALLFVMVSKTTAASLPNIPKMAAPAPIHRCRRSSALRIRRPSVGRYRICSTEFLRWSRKNYIITKMDSNFKTTAAKINNWNSQAMMMIMMIMGVDHGGTRGTSPPRIWSRGR